MRNIIRLAFLWLLFLPIFSHAENRGLPGGNAIMGLYSAAKGYQLTHPNTMPSFEELTERMDAEWLKRKQSEFIWLDTPVVFRHGAIQAITAYPILEDRKKDIGRYALYFDNKSAVDVIWAEEGELQRVFAATAQAPLAGKLYVQPVTMWDKLPEYLKRMSDQDRAAFIKKMKDQYQLSISNDGRIALLSTPNAVATTQTPGISAITQVAPQAKPVEIPLSTPTPTPRTKEPTNPVWWIVGAIAALASMVFVVRWRNNEPKG